ncbi:MAG: hypothetical protein EAX96_04760 [Candidatus Lokiarchaeota archaeon]|nr:hypothetical protein [Candidatus Lokiarchaeota archaeon]
MELLRDLLFKTPYPTSSEIGNIIDYLRAINVENTNLLKLFGDLLNILKKGKNLENLNLNELFNSSKKQLQDIRVKFGEILKNSKVFSPFEEFTTSVDNFLQYFDESFKIFFKNFNNPITQNEIQDKIGCCNDIIKQLNTMKDYISNFILNLQPYKTYCIIQDSLNSHSYSIVEPLRVYDEKFMRTLPINSKAELQPILEFLNSRDILRENNKNTKLENVIEPNYGLIWSMNKRSDNNKVHLTGFIFFIIGSIGLTWFLEYFWGIGGLLIGWISALSGVGLHIGLDIVKEVRRSEPRTFNGIDLVKMLIVRIGPALWNIVLIVPTYALYVLLDIIFLGGTINWIFAIIVGYASDSFFDTFINRFDKIIEKPV